MSKKAEIIEREVILITKKLNRETLTYKINIEKFNSCRIYKENISIKKEFKTYYCKTYQDYYANYEYCLIINPNKTDDAMSSFFYEVKNKLSKDAETLQNLVDRLNKRINNISEIESTFKIV